MKETKLTKTSLVDILKKFEKDNPLYHINTTFLRCDDKSAVAQVTISILNQQGQALRKATGTKSQGKTPEFDYVEAAEKGALLNALNQLGL